MPPTPIDLRRELARLVESCRKEGIELILAGGFGVVLRVETVLMARDPTLATIGVRSAARRFLA